MPSATKHLRRAQTHFEAATRMQSEVELMSWAAVVAFYVARDLAHAVFDADTDLSQACRHPMSHTNQDLSAPGTNAVIKRHYRKIESAYIDLYSMSRGVRYEGQILGAKQLAEMFSELGEVARWAMAELSGRGRVIPEWITGLGRTPTEVPEGADDSL